MNPRNHYFTLAAASARYAAWWQGGRLDRPPHRIDTGPSASPFICRAEVSDSSRAALQRLAAFVRAPVPRVRARKGVPS